MLNSFKFVFLRCVYLTIILSAILIRIFSSRFHVWAYFYIEFVPQFLFKRVHFNNEMWTTFQFQTRNVLLLFFVLIFSIAVLTFPFVYFVEDENEHYKPMAGVVDVGGFDEFTTSDDSVGGDIGRCYKFPKSFRDKNQRSIRYLDDILDGMEQPTPGTTIFFHETTCSNTSIISLNAK